MALKIYKVETIKFLQQPSPPEMWNTLFDTDVVTIKTENFNSKYPIPSTPILVRFVESLKTMQATSSNTTISGSRPDLGVP